MGSPTSKRLGLLPTPVPCTQVIESSSRGAFIIAARTLVIGTTGPAEDGLFCQRQSRAEGGLEPLMPRTPSPPPLSVLPPVQESKCPTPSAYHRQLRRRLHPQPLRQKLCYPLPEEFFRRPHSRCRSRCRRRIPHCCRCDGRCMSHVQGCLRQRGSTNCATAASIGTVGVRTAPIADAATVADYITVFLVTPAVVVDIAAAGVADGCLPLHSDTII